MGATHEEILGLADHMDDKDVTRLAKRDYISGRLFGAEVVIVLSRWGKVAASSTATTLIQKFNVKSLVMTGLAGAVDSNLQVGDIVVASSLYQHDLDSRPLFEQFEIPFLERSHIATDPNLSNRLLKATKQFCLKHAPDNLTYSGTIISGDQFIGTEVKRNELIAKCSDAVAVEMEGAAVAQVCYEHGIPFGVIRTISDAANHSSAEHFSDFLKNKAPLYTIEIIREFLQTS